MRSVRVLLAPAIVGMGVIWAAACGESTGPSRGGPGLAAIRGAGQTDTALTRLVQALVVEVRDSTGAPARRETVRFEALPTDNPSYYPSVYLAPLAANYYGTFVADSTDQAGLASVLVQLGQVAGQGRVLVTVPRLGLADTVGYTILPASATQVVAAPEDTALFVGSRATLRGYVADSYGNRRQDPVTYQTLDNLTRVDAAGMLTAQAIGRATVLLRASSLAVDTVHVSVVPQGTIAAVSFGFLNTSPGTIVTLKLDGSGVAPIPGSAGENYYLSWASAGTRLSFYRPSYPGHVYTIDLAGTTTLLVQPPGTFLEDNWPLSAASGSYIFFRGVRQSGGGHIWRIRPDGTGLDSMSAGSYEKTWPAPSPDGASVAYATLPQLAGGFDLRVYDYGSGRDTPLGVAGLAAHWSPTGEWIAYTTDYPSSLNVIHPDGTGQRTLVASVGYAAAFGWSPDGNWIIARPGAYLEIIEVQTGLRLPLAFTGALRDPAWKP